jgi:hypothetical protein
MVEDKYVAPGDGLLHEKPEELTIRTDMWDSCWP